MMGRRWELKTNDGNKMIKSHFSTSSFGIRLSMTTYCKRLSLIFSQKSKIGKLPDQNKDTKTLPKPPKQ
jgi:hypothetical protein